MMWTLLRTSRGIQGQQTHCTVLYTVHTGIAWVSAVMSHDMHVTSVERCQFHLLVQKRQTCE